MKFETKFNSGDRVWYMKDNKPTECVISAIEIFSVGTNKDRITYTANVTPSVSWLDHTKLPESALFASKKDLLESLHNVSCLHFCKYRVFYESVSCLFME